MSGGQANQGTARETSEDSGRFRQRRRTRAAIVDAGADLLRQGRATPGVNEIAEAADVSRRTVYQYFPTVDQLLLDATLGLLTQTDVDAAIDAAGAGHPDAAERVEAMIHALGDVAAGQPAPAQRAEGMTPARGDLPPHPLPIGRSLIRLPVDTPEPARPKRGY